MYKDDCQTKWALIRGPFFIVWRSGRGRVGNWAFGSGRGRAAGLMHDDRDDDGSKGSSNKSKQ